MLTTKLVSKVISQLLYLASSMSDYDITLNIYTDGGYVEGALGIYDVMKQIKPDVVTVGIGRCCSAGAFLLSSGTKGKRKALAHTSIMIHQVASANGYKKV